MLNPNQLALSLESEMQKENLRKEIDLIYREWVNERYIILEDYYTQEQLCTLILSAPETTRLYVASDISIEKLQYITKFFFKYKAIVLHGGLSFEQIDTVLKYLEWTNSIVISSSCNLAQLKAIAKGMPYLGGVELSPHTTVENISVFVKNLNPYCYFYCHYQMGEIQLYTAASHMAPGVIFSLRANKISLDGKMISSALCQSFSIEILKQAVNLLKPGVLFCYPYFERYKDDLMQIAPCLNPGSGLFIYYAPTDFSLKDLIISMKPETLLWHEVPFAPFQYQSITEGLIHNFDVKVVDVKDSFNQIKIDNITKLARSLPELVFSSSLPSFYAESGIGKTVLKNPYLVREMIKEIKFNKPGHQFFLCASLSVSNLAELSGQLLAHHYYQIDSNMSQKQLDSLMSNVPERFNVLISDNNPDIFLVALCKSLPKLASVKPSPSLSLEKIKLVASLIGEERILCMSENASEIQLTVAAKNINPGSVFSINASCTQPLSVLKSSIRLIKPGVIFECSSNTSKKELLELVSILKKKSGFIIDKSLDGPTISAIVLAMKKGTKIVCYDILDDYQNRFLIKALDMNQGVFLEFRHEAILQRKQKIAKELDFSKNEIEILSDMNEASLSKCSQKKVLIDVNKDEKNSISLAHMKSDNVKTSLVKTVKNNIRRSDADLHYSLFSVLKKREANDPSLSETDKRFCQALEI